MTHLEMDAIEIEDAPVLLQTTLAPSGKLLLEILVEATNRAGAWGYSHQGFGHCSYFMGARARYEHVGQALSNLRL
jgi:hypothetical protein